MINCQANTSNPIFQQVDYHQFRHHLDGISTGKVKEKNFETLIYDRQNSIQAIVHAASIDKEGNCFPAEYFILSTAAEPALLMAA